MGNRDRGPVPAALSSLLGGSLGLILDSWLGATVQGDSAAVQVGLALGLSWMAA